MYEERIPEYPIVGIALSYKLCAVKRSKNSMTVRTGDRLASMYLKAPSVKTSTPTKSRPMKFKSRFFREDETSNELSNIGGQEEYDSILFPPPGLRYSRCSKYERLSFSCVWIKDWQAR